MATRICRRIFSELALRGWVRSNLARKLSQLVGLREDSGGNQPQRPEPLINV